MALKLRNVTQTPKARQTSRIATRVAAAFDAFLPAQERRFAIRLWDGSVIPPGQGEPQWTLVLNSPAVLRTAFWHPTDLALGEAFLRGEWDVEGDLEQIFTLATAIRRYHATPRDLLRFAALLVTSGREPTSGGALLTEPAHYDDGGTSTAHSREQDLAAIRHHYDISNDFYALWLDQRMVYSCAYFRTGAEEIDVAQAAKLDLICRKLRLQPGERFLDIGCGWGALILHAAQHFGVNATGITLSAAQAQLARERIAAAGLEDRCQVEIRDYRDLPAAWFDKVASVGMAEHVGRKQMDEYFVTAFHALKPGGLFLNHAIAELPPFDKRQHSALGNNREDDFIQQYVFPDGELLPVSETLAFAEGAGFEVVDLEGLRRHYLLTLRQWQQRLVAREQEALQMVEPVIYRVWRLYLAGAAHSFAAGENSIFQALLARPCDDGTSLFPLTREDIYLGEHLA